MTVQWFLSYIVQPHVREGKLVQPTVNEGKLDQSSVRVRKTSTAKCE